MGIALQQKVWGLNTSQLRKSAQYAVDSLFRHFAVEVLVIDLSLVAGMVDDTVPMIRQHVERIELQRKNASD